MENKVERERLPEERNGIVHRFLIYTDEGPVKGYVNANVYEDGRVGELFVKMDRQGSAVSGFFDAWAIAVSILLQQGTPLKAVCEKFKGMAFEPSGMTDSKDPDLRFARSPIDYISRWLEKKFVD